MLKFIRLSLFSVTVFACSIAFAAKKPRAPGAPSCLAYLTGGDVAKTPGPMRAEITPLLERYKDLKVGIGWGARGYRVAMTALSNPVTGTSLPTSPKLGEGSRFFFVTALDGKLKDPQNGIESEWASLSFRTVAHKFSSGQLFYILSSDVTPKSADASLFLYLTALNAVPHANALELTIQAEKSDASSDLYKKIQEALLDGDSAESVGDQIAAPAIRSLKKSSLFKSVTTQVFQYDADQIVRDPEKADAFMVTYTFLLKDRPTLN